jgi:hypothetical protein
MLRFGADFSFFFRPTVRPMTLVGRHSLKIHRNISSYESKFTFFA